MVPKQLNLIRTHVTQFNNFENNLGWMKGESDG